MPCSFFPEESPRQSNQVEAILRLLPEQRIRATHDNRHIVKSYCTETLPTNLSDTDPEFPTTHRIRVTPAASHGASVGPIARYPHESDTAVSFFPSWRRPYF